jgi:hypothetical protein
MKTLYDSFSLDLNCRDRILKMDHSDIVIELADDLTIEEADQKGMAHLTIVTVAGVRHRISFITQTKVQQAISVNMKIGGCFSLATFSKDVVVHADKISMAIIETAVAKLRDKGALAYYALDE